MQQKRYRNENVTVTKTLHVTKTLRRDVKISIFLVFWPGYQKGRFLCRNESVACNENVTVTKTLHVTKTLRRDVKISIFLDF